MNTSLLQDVRDFDELLQQREDKIDILNSIDNMEFLSLLLKTFPDRDYIENLRPKKVEELNRYLDPYSSLVTEHNKDQKLLFAYTNLKNETIIRMEMFGVIAYLFQSVNEYGLSGTDKLVKPDKDLDEETRKNKEIIYNHLLDVFKYDPLKHVRSCYSAYKDKEMNLKNQLFIMPENIRKELRPIVENLPSADLFAHYDRFRSFYYNEIYGLVNHIFGLSNKLDFKLIPYMIGTDDEIERFQKEHGGDMRIKTSVVKVGTWSMLGPFRQNSENIKFRIEGNDETTIDANVNRIMRTVNKEKLTNEINALRAKRIQDQNNLSSENKEALHRYGDMIGISDIITEALNEKGELPDDAIEYGVIVHDAATGETQEGKLFLKDRVDM